MKKSLLHLLPLAGLAAALPLTAQETAAPATPPPPGEPRELRVLSDDGPGAPGGPHGNMRFFRHPGPGEMETVAYLGVETSPVGGALAAQLNLAAGTGLVVGHVSPDSPAASVFKKYDVLLKLGDQQLIEPRQFAVLVRQHQEGDTVTLTYLRGGKEATATVKLAKHDVPKFALAEGPGGFPGMAFGFGDGDGPGPEIGRADMDRMLSLMDGNGMPGLRRMNLTREAGPGDRMLSVTVNTGDSNMAFSDEQGSLDLKIADGKKTLTAKDPKGAVVFSGPVNTPEERKKLPADVRERLEKIESMNEFSFKTDGDFQPGPVKVAKPAGTKIIYVGPRDAPVRVLLRRSEPR
ncbi:MAG: PDZ domain-containing protein [Verrucomicrobia bacterium]|nr:PDZ domain-containing protein [Verrucomicrobiota bacterium]